VELGKKFPKEAIASALQTGLPRTLEVLKEGLKQSKHPESSTQLVPPEAQDDVKSRYPYPVRVFGLIRLVQQA
jgi:hypothetical protein